MPPKRASKPLPRVVSASMARRHFGQIMKRAKEKSERFFVLRRGETLAVIMGVRDYIHAPAPDADALRVIQAEAKRKGLDKLTMRQINAEIAAARREQRQKEAAEKHASK